MTDQTELMDRFKLGETHDFVFVMGQLACRLAPHQTPLAERKEVSGKPPDLWIYYWNHLRWVPLRPANARDALDFAMRKVTAEEAAIFHLIDKVHRT